MRTTAMLPRLPAPEYRSQASTVAWPPAALFGHPPNDGSPRGDLSRVSHALLALLGELEP